MATLTEQPDPAAILAEMVKGSQREQKDIAAAADVSPAQLSRMISGKRTIRAEAAFDLEDALGVDDGRLVSAVHALRRWERWQSGEQGGAFASRRLTWAEYLHVVLPPANHTPATHRFHVTAAA